MRARDDYAFYLALGLTLLVAFSTRLISGGVLDLSPLSGVVTPSFREAEMLNSLPHTTRVISPQIFLAERACRCLNVNVATRRSRIGAMLMRRIGELLRLLLLHGGMSTVIVADSP